MRESNYSFPPQNRAVVSITHLLYDRRALDTNAPLAILNNLTSLTYLTSTSPRIRDILTLDGGLERLLDILRDSCLPREYEVTPDLWGLNGPPTARVIGIDQQITLRHSLAFQCVVNIGVRGSEAIRTRVVQAGALDLVAQILESWLQEHGIAIFAGPVGSQAAVDAIAVGHPVPGTEGRRRAPRPSASRHAAAASTSTIRTGTIAGFGASIASSLGFRSRAPETRTQTRNPDTDVDMADAENDENTDSASVGAGDDSMDVDEDDSNRAGPSTTPRATQTILPMAINIPPRNMSQASSAGNSLTSEDAGPLPRATSDNALPTSVVSQPRPPALPSRLAQDPLSTQSSPMGSPSHHDSVEAIRPGRRGTIVARPLNLAPRNERRLDDPTGSGTSDGGEEIDLPAAIIEAGIAAANEQALQGGGTVVADQPGPPPDVEIVDNTIGAELDEPDADLIAAEQARLDLEAGAPPGQPGAAQTPRMPRNETTPQQLLTQPAAANPQQAQIIIANGAPRGFQDLGSYVGIAALLNPDGDRYSDDSILLALQLLAYLSKYPHVRSAFHHPRRPMHPSFELGTDRLANPLPERPAYSQTPNIFSLVERFTFRPSPSDPLLFRIPSEIQYWAGVIMRNACRKDEARGGIRQCAAMSCGRWETFPREFAKCRRCRKAKYCSKECQSKAWQEGHRFCIRPDDPGPGNGGEGGSPGGGAPPPGPGPGDDDDFDNDFPTAHIADDLLARVRAVSRGTRTVVEIDPRGGGPRLDGNEQVGQRQDIRRNHADELDNPMPGGLDALNPVPVRTPVVPPARGVPLRIDTTLVAPFQSRVPLGGGLGHGRVEAAGARPTGTVAGARPNPTRGMQATPRPGGGGAFSRFGFGRRAE